MIFCNISNNGVNPRSFIINLRDFNNHLNNKTDKIIGVFNCEFYKETSSMNVTILLRGRKNTIRSETFTYVVSDLAIPFRRLIAKKFSKIIEKRIVYSITKDCVRFKHVVPSDISGSTRVLTPGFVNTKYISAVNDIMFELCDKEPFHAKQIFFKRNSEISLNLSLKEYEVLEKFFERNGRYDLLL